jgi:hypothetical protein
MISPAEQEAAGDEDRSLCQLSLIASFLLARK